MAALEGRLLRGEPIEGIATVASFFVSRVDTKVDAALDVLRGSLGERGRALRGRIAIANAKLAYAAQGRSLRTERWERLAAAGARPQRLLWASTSTKDPAYPDLHYAGALVGRDTIDTMTHDTIRALLDHGRIALTLGQGLAEAQRQLDELKALGIDLASVTRELEVEGVRSFTSSFHQALSRIREKRHSLNAA
jgi:transaldolase